MATTPMTREDIKSVFDEASEIEKALGGIPHREAVPALKALETILDLVGEQLPGGYGGTCISCEEVVGSEELVDCGDEYMCGKCATLSIEAERAEKSAQ